MASFKPAQLHGERERTIESTHTPMSLKTATYGTFMQHCALVA